MRDIGQGRGDAIASLILQWDSVVSRLPVVRVKVSQLQASWSPRRVGVDSAHVEVLAQVGADLPPILVHRTTMQVVDGMHRVAAARARGAETIEAKLVDGNVNDVFVLAVRANVAHGLALTLAERKSAALGMLASHAEWSDRLIAAATGLSNKTVGAIRRNTTEEDSQLAPRIGRDGKHRPMSNTQGRNAAAELFRRDPHATVASVAAASGLSIGTVRDVRTRVLRGEDPAPRRRERNSAAEMPRGKPAPTDRTRKSPPGDSDSPTLIFDRLRRDPTLRFSENGRGLLRALSVLMASTRECTSLVGLIPPHSVVLVAQLARQHASEWSGLADRLEANPDSVDTIHPLAELEHPPGQDPKAG